MANTPDFNYKPDTAMIQALQNAQQQKLIQEQQAQQKKQQQFQMVRETTQSISDLVDTMVKTAETRKTKQVLEAAKSMLAKPEPQKTIPAGPEDFSSVPNPAYDKYQKARLDIMAKLAPTQLGEQMAKQAFPEQKTVNPANLQTKSILFNGQPREALFNPDNGNFSDPNTKEVLSGDIKPYSQATPTALNDEDRKRLTPMARAVIEGRATPGALVSARGAEKEKLSQVVAELDPSFDLTLAPQRAQLRKEFTNGTSAKNLTALNTVVGHLDTLDKSLAGLDNTNIKKYNTLKQYFNSEIGKPEVSKFIAAKNAVDSELAKVFQGTGVVTDSERADFKKAMDISSSPEQAKAVIEQYTDLMRSRIAALQGNWQQTMGDIKSPTPFTNSKTKKILSDRGYNPDTLEKLETPVSADWVDAGNGIKYRVKK